MATNPETILGNKPVSQVIDLRNRYDISLIEIRDGVWQAIDRITFGEYAVKGIGPSTQEAITHLLDQLAEIAARPNRLKPGDRVRWAGGWGSDAERIAKVVRVLVSDNGNPDDAVETHSVAWEDVEGRGVVVDLDNGHWAYGAQIRPLLDDGMPGTDDLEPTVEKVLYGGGPFEPADVVRVPARYESEE